MDFSSQTVVIIGAARQGLALARYLALHAARVIITDRRSEHDLAAEISSLADLDVHWVLGEHPMSLLDEATLLCPSGGVPLTLPLIVEAQRRGIRLSNDSQIFLEAAPCPVLGITGSAGKTTTTTLVGRTAQAATVPPARAWIGGNIGFPLIAHVDEMAPEDIAVMELSSFQLEIMTRSPQVAAVLNVTPNHLDRHGTMEAYTAAKARILEYQTVDDTAVLSRDDPGAWEMRSRIQGHLLTFGLHPLPTSIEGAYLRGSEIWLRVGGEDLPVMDTSEILLRGEHNLSNVLASCAVAAAAGFSPEAMLTGVQGFTGVAHRLEFVRSWGGARWYNDSIASAPERVIAAIRSFDEPLVLLAGGRDKDLPWQKLAELVARRVDHVVLFGEAAEKIETALLAAGAEDRIAAHCKSLREAVKAAAAVVEPGDVVLLSPGGTSFDEFRDFEERGECFARLVCDLE